MTRVFLAAGVAALAIAAPAAAKPEGGGGGKSGNRAAQVERGGQAKAAKIDRGSQFRATNIERTREFRAPKVERQRGSQMRFATLAEPRGKGPKAETKMRADVGGQRVKAEQRIAKQQLRERSVSRNFKAERSFANQGVKAQQKLIKQQNKQFERVAVGDQIRVDHVARVRGSGRVLTTDNVWCPPGLLSKGCIPPGHGINAASRIASADAFRTSRLAALAGTRILSPLDAMGFVGSPLSTVANMVALSALPSSVQYLYPNTDDYYYRYGNGYLYQVDRDTSLIASLLPLLGGGFLPGQILPASYMNSYVPNYYGFNSFYPDTPYDCNRYVNGVIYEVDCYTGLIEDVVPLYASGYGVGQMLPSSYGYYNVPSQYRSLYYNTPDYNYWYAPGAIYQYDPSSSLITSVAALLTPGFAIGQQLPMGYSTYNVPLGYRDMYYDTPNAWYRYNNGYIYQVDPVTQLVTAIVASILT